MEQDATVEQKLAALGESVVTLGESGLRNIDRHFALLAIVSALIRATPNRDVFLSALAEERKRYEPSKTDQASWKAFQETIDGCLAQLDLTAG